MIWPSEFQKKVLSVLKRQHDDNFKELPGGYQPQTTLRSTSSVLKVYHVWEEERNLELPKEMVTTNLLLGQDLKKQAE